ncbi:MAG: hypothetical protein WC360_04220, partial [Opitutales bacterium]
MSHSSSAFSRQTSSIAPWIESHCTFACRLDAAGNVLELGCALATLLGFDLGAGQPKGLVFAEFAAAPEQRELVTRVFLPGHRAEAPGFLELILRAPDGWQGPRVRWVLEPMDTDDGRPGYIARGWSEQDWPAMLSQALYLGRVVELTAEAAAIIDNRGFIEY